MRLENLAPNDIRSLGIIVRLVALVRYHAVMTLSAVLLFLAVSTHYVAGAGELSATLQSWRNKRK